MFELQIAPSIIAGLLVVTGYMFMRWLSNLGELKQWKALVANRQDIIEAMQAEGCAAQGALQNIFNGVTAQGVPISPTMRKVAECTAAALTECPVCDHKERAEDAELLNYLLNEDAVRLAEEFAVARLNAENWQNIAVENERRAEESERLLGLVNDHFLILEAQQEQEEDTTRR